MNTAEQPVIQSAAVYQIREDIHYQLFMMGQDTEQMPVLSTGPQPNRTDAWTTFKNMSKGSEHPGAIAQVASSAKREGWATKHAPYPMVRIPKDTKLRSRTGCWTWRKRKKKCDVRKPECMIYKKFTIVFAQY